MNVRDLFLAVGIHADSGHIEAPVLIKSWDNPHPYNTSHVEWDDKLKAFVIHVA